MNIRCVRYTLGTFSTALGLSVAAVGALAFAATASGANPAKLEAKATADPDDPRDPEQPDLGPPVADETPDALRLSLKDRKNHDKLQQGKAAPQSYPTGPQHAVTRVLSEKSKKSQ